MHTGTLLASVVRVRKRRCAASGGRDRVSIYREIFVTLQLYHVFSRGNKAIVCSLYTLRPSVPDALRCSTRSRMRSAPSKTTSLPYQASPLVVESAIFIAVAKMAPRDFAPLSLSLSLSLSLCFPCDAIVAQRFFFFSFFLSFRS